MNTIKLTIRGIPVEVTTAADAFELIRLSEEAGRPPHSAPSERKPAEYSPPSQKAQTAEPQALRLTLDFLRAIHGGGATGIGTDRVMPALKVTSGKAVGSRLGYVNRVIEGAGFPTREVYSNKKSAEGRVWKPRKSMEAAIANIEAQLNAVQ